MPVETCLSQINMKATCCSRRRPCWPQLRRTPRADRCHLRRPADYAGPFWVDRRRLRSGPQPPMGIRLPATTVGFAASAQCLPRVRPVGDSVTGRIAAGRRTLIGLPITRRVGPMSVRFHSPPTSSPVPGVDAPGATVFSVECPVCDHANPAGAKFCNDCGSRVDLEGCPKCDAINDRESAFCYKCGAPIGAPTSPKREAERVALAPSVNDATTDDDHGSITVATRSATSESTIAGFVMTQGMTAQEWSEETASRRRTSPIDVPIRQDRLMHFVDDAHTAATYRLTNVEPAGVTCRIRRGLRRRPIMLAVGSLLVLFATAVIAVFAHYRPGAIDRTIATARSAWRVAASPTPAAITPGWSKAAEEPGTRSISTAPVSVTVRPPTQAPAIVERTPERTPGGGTQKAQISSADSPSRTSADVSARRPFSTSTSDPAGNGNGNVARPVPCTEALAAMGLCTPAAQSSD